jgi:hypothetical protein
MLLFLPVGFLLATLLALALLPRIQPSFRSSWLLSLVGASFSLFSLLYLRFQLPQQFSFTGWEFGPGMQFGLNWVLDANSWPLAFALIAMLLAALLSAVARAPHATWWSWMPGISLVAAAIFTVLANDVLAFVLGWALVDSLVLAFSMVFLRNTKDLKSSLLSFSFPTIGTMLMLWTAVQYTVSDLSLAALPPRAAILLVLVAVCRLGLPPFNPYGLPDQEEFVLDSRLLMLFAPLAPVLAFLLRFPHPLSTARIPVFFLLLIAGYYGSLKWFGRRREMGTSPNFIAALAALALLAAAMGQAAAALAWSLALLLGGSFFYLAERQSEQRMPLLIGGIFVLTALPFTPLYAGAAIYQPSADWVPVTAVGIHALLMAAWLRRAQALRQADSPERWISTIRFVAQLVLLLSAALLGLGLAPTLKPSEVSTPVWVGLLALPFAAILFLASRNRELLPASFGNRFKQDFSFGWLQAAFLQLERGLSAMFHLVSAVLEGRAGVLWALLTVVLLLSLIIQIVPAGL